MRLYWCPAYLWQPDLVSSIQLNFAQWQALTMRAQNICSMEMGVFNAMLSLWSPDVPNLAAFTYLGVPEDWGVPGHRMFPLWRILCLPRHFVAGGDVFMAANPGRSRSCPPRNFGDTDWQRFTLTAGTGFGHMRIEMHLFREQVRGAVPTRYFGKNTANSSLSTSKLIKTIGRCSLLRSEWLRIP